VEQVLAAFLKAIGFIIPLMDAMYANYYTRELMVILVREFQTPDEEMKKIVLKVNPNFIFLYLLNPRLSSLFDSPSGGDSEQSDEMVL
jgi:hypothetical protein